MTSVVLLHLVLAPALIAGCSGGCGEMPDPDDEIDSFIAGLRQGQALTPLHDGPENAEILALMAASESHTIETSKSVSDGDSPSDLGDASACARVRLESGGRSARIQVRLEDHENLWTLADLSRNRRCNCPGFTGPCVMAPARGQPGTKALH